MSRRRDHIVLRNVGGFLWIMIPFSVMCIFAFCAAIRDEDMGQRIAGYLFALLAITVVYIAYSGYMWKIEFGKKDDFFIWRPSFWKTHIVKYSDCMYIGNRNYITYETTLKLKWGKRTITVSNWMYRSDIFENMIRKHHVKERRVPPSARLKWLKDKIKLQYVPVVLIWIFGVGGVLLLLEIALIVILLVKLPHEEIMEGIIPFSILFIFLLSFPIGEMIILPQLVKAYPKHKKLLRGWIPEYMFKGEPEPGKKRYTKKK